MYLSYLLSNDINLEGAEFYLKVLTEYRFNIFDKRIIINELTISS